MQPQQYQYPPQGYAPQPQPQYVPQAPPAPQPAPAPNGAPMFHNPAAPGAGDTLAPKIYELAGCLVFFEPTALTPAGTGDNLTGYGKDAPRDRITTNITILATGDGQPITIGRTDPADPPTHVVSAPARFVGVWMSNVNIVRALAPDGQPLVGAKVLGRIVRSEVGQKPWNVVAVDGTPDMALAVETLNRIGLGQLAYAEPQPLAAPAPANSVQYAPQAQPQMQQPMQAPPAYGWPQNVPQPQPQQQMAPPPQQQAPQGYGVPAQQINQWAGAPVAVPPQPGFEPPSHLAAMGWTAGTWGPLTDAQKQQVLQANPA